MPPKKRAKTTRRSDAGPATTMTSLNPVQHALGAWVDTVYSRRHACPSDMGASTAPDMAWPVLHGGTFTEIAQRAWSQPERLITMSLEVLKKSGVVPKGHTSDDMGMAFCKFKDAASHT
jgi:hypothetical protein